MHSDSGAAPRRERPECLMVSCHGRIRLLFKQAWPVIREEINQKENSSEQRSYEKEEEELCYINSSF